MKFEYNELIPDDLIDTFYDQIKRCIDESTSYDMYIKCIMKINGDNIPNKIKELISQ